MKTNNLNNIYELVISDLKTFNKANSIEINFDNDHNIIEYEYKTILETLDEVYLGEHD